MATIGEHIRDARKRAGLTLRKLAEVSGTGFGHLGQIERGEVVPRMDMVEKIADALGTSTESLVGGGKRAPGRIPVINKSPAGPPVRYDSDQGAAAESHDAWEYIDRGGVNDPDAYAIEVIEDSMEPTLRPGDRVILLPVTESTPRRAHVKDGAIVLIRVGEQAPDPGTCFCRLRLNGDGSRWFLKDNPRHKPVMLERDWIEQMGVAIEVRRRL